MYEAYGRMFETAHQAKKYVESLPYWAEAISKDGLVQTVWGTDGVPLCQRQAVVSGIGNNRKVTMSSWYDL